MANPQTDSVLWPLLHRMPDKVIAEESWSPAYQEVNEVFADNILPYVEDDHHLLYLYHVQNQLNQLMKDRIYK